MKISAKGRYALASMLEMAQKYGGEEYITVISISKKLDISKIYLEQVFALLKRAELVDAVKGAQGGYRLARDPSKITVLDIFAAVELTLFETAGKTVPDTAPIVEDILREKVFDVLDQKVESTLAGITLGSLLAEIKNRVAEQGYMYYL